MVAQRRCHPQTYGQAVDNAWKRADKANRLAGGPGVERWTRHQLHHAAATFICRHDGHEAAQTLLGHSDPKITLRYAEADQAKARAAAKTLTLADLGTAA